MALPKKETLMLFKQALEVEWLKTPEEVFQYFTALMEAYYWGKKIDEENEKSKTKSLKDKYNI